MDETNGIYPVSERRHEENCKGCLEPQNCDCLCDTCRKSREEYYSRDYFVLTNIKKIKND